MADFRKWFYALAVVALLAGLSIPASAQIGGTAVTCNNGGATTPIVRSQGLTELMGDLVLNCTGGSPTLPNQAVPPVNITVILSVNITSKLVSGGALAFNEALLIIDEPNQAAPGPNSNRPILNCGAAGAPDTGLESGPGVCSIISDGNPVTTYNGVQNKFGTTTCAASVFGCGSPNVFQGRQGNQLNAGLINNISFLGVPFDPPGTSTTRVLRFTNIRGNASQQQIASTFIQIPITAQVAINGSTAFSVNIPFQGQVLAYIQNGLTVSTPLTRVASAFLQCNTENGLLTPTAFGGSGRGFGPGSSACGGLTGGGCNSGATSPNPFAATPTVRFSEGFATAFKVRNISEILANGTFVNGSYVYNGGLINPADLNQNVPGAIYNTEAGFEYNSAFQSPSPASTPPSLNQPPSGNPPAGTGNGAATGSANVPIPLNSASTGISTAGIATQGTRLFLSFTGVPGNAAIFVPPVVFLFRQNAALTPYPTFRDTATVAGVAAVVPGLSSGVAVLVTTDAAGDTGYSPTDTSLPTAIASGGSTTTSNGPLVQVSNNLAVYEVLFDDPNSLESVDVPVVVAYVSQLSANPPVGFPVPNQIAQVTGGFAPFYTQATAQNPQPTTSFPIPRFLPGNTPLNLFQIIKCACDLLFPFVTSTQQFDTGIAIANTSADPGGGLGLNGFSPGATSQQGAVQFWYYGVGANGAAPPATQTSAIVPAGQVLTYVLSSGLGGIGTGPNGLDNRAAGFQGYIITQAGFQYCHAFAFISGIGEGPLQAGISEGYLALVLDDGGLFRTLQASENLLH